MASADLDFTTSVFVVNVFDYPLSTLLQHQENIFNASALFHQFRMEKQMYEKVFFGIVATPKDEPPIYWVNIQL